MAQPATIYEQLTGVKISSATIDQLDFTKNTFIDANSISWWKGPITISKVIEASRTYPHGLGIPESGTITTEALSASSAISFQPPGTEIWKVLGISIIADAGTPTINVFLDSGSATCIMHTGSSSTAPGSFFPFEAPFTISNSLYLTLFNLDGSNDVTAALAYSKVGL